MQCFTITAAVMLANHNGFDNYFKFFLTEGSPGYPIFNSIWFHSFGNMLVWIIIFNFVIPQIINVSRVLWLTYKRYLDRGGCSKPLQKGLDGDINSKKLILADV